jgi:hypothetical protein
VEDVIDITNHEEVILQVMCNYYRFEVLYMLQI